MFDCLCTIKNVNHLKGTSTDTKTKLCGHWSEEQPLQVSHNECTLDTLCFPDFSITWLKQPTGELLLKKLVVCCAYPRLNL